MMGFLALQPCLARTASPPVASPAANTLVDINSATLRDLDALQGMGPDTAVAVAAGRPYTAKEDLLNRNIIPPATYDRIKDRIMVGPPVDPTAKLASKKKAQNP
jgi:DNA uptake protein ComE-like DNA-binding protein